MLSKTQKLQLIKRIKPFSLADIIAILLAIILSLGYIIYMLGFNEPSERISIMVYNGQTYYYSLSENKTITQDDLGLNAGQITIKIENGRAFVSYSSCKNQICVHMRAIRFKGETITCIPLGVRIKVEGGLNLVTG